MSHFYLDASAIVKRYSPETGSAWVRSLIDPLSGHILALSKITLAEVAAALAVKHRALGGITRQERDNASLSLYSRAVAKSLDKLLSAELLRAAVGGEAISTVLGRALGIASSLRSSQ